MDKDKLFQYISLLVSIVAIVLSILSYLATKKQAEAAIISESPYLHISTSASNLTGEYGVYLYNVGKGVAILEKIEINGTEYNKGIGLKEWSRIFREANLSELEGCYSFSSPENGAGVGEGGSFPIIALNPMMATWLKNPNQNIAALAEVQDLPVLYPVFYKNNSSLPLSEEKKQQDAKNLLINFFSGLSEKEKNESRNKKTEEFWKYYKMMIEAQTFEEDYQKSLYETNFKIAVNQCLIGISEIDRKIDIKITYKNRINDDIEDAKRMKLYK